MYCSAHPSPYQVLQTYLTYRADTGPAFTHSDDLITFIQSCQMAKFDPFLSLDCARVEGEGAQSK